jgi:DNA mismatch repair protein MSH6
VSHPHPAGAAIATAVLDQLAHQVGCCGLLATHYHQLAAAHAADPAVALMHMACAVSGSSDDREAAAGLDASGAPCTPGSGADAGRPGVAAEEVTFLYKLTPGEQGAIDRNQHMQSPMMVCWCRLLLPAVHN